MGAACHPYTLRVYWLFIHRGKHEFLFYNITSGSNPVVLSGLSHGTHQLKVMPTGCGSNRKNLKTEINIE